MKNTVIAALAISLLLGASAFAEEVPEPMAAPAEETIQPQTTAPEPETSTDPAISVIPSDQPAYEIHSLFDGHISSHGGYGAVGYKPTSIDGEIGHLTGGRAGWIINHSFMIGAAGYGLANSQIMREFDGEQKRLHFGYGGIELGYTFFSGHLVHVVAHALFAGGGIGTMERVEVGTDEDGDEEYDWEGPVDSVFVLEPTLQVELNVTDWFRIALGGSYRLVEGCELKGVSNQDLSGASAELLFKFGYF